MTLPPGWLDAPAHQLDVWTVHLPQPVLMGRLRVEVASGDVLFEWSDEARERHLEVSPLMLPLAGGVWSSRRGADLPPDYLGLPGFLNDALPDGWGLYLMNKALERAGIGRAQLTPAVRLAFLADRSWGSLSFVPVVADDNAATMTLDELGRDMHASIEGHLEAVSDALLQAGSSPQGARPKVMVDCDDAFHHARVTAGLPDPGFRSWLIKFAARDEPADAPLMEQVYMDLAREAGLRVMESRLIDIHGTPAFATARFDRMGARRVFTHTLGGLLHFSHRDVGLDYANIAEVMDRLQVPEDRYHEAYARAVFNAVMSVRDDHAKNFAFVKAADDRWDIAPAYDLTYMSGPGGYHTMTFAGGAKRDPMKADLLRLAAFYRVGDREARAVIESVLDVGSGAARAAKGLGVSAATLAPIEARLDAIRRPLG